MNLINIILICVMFAIGVTMIVHGFSGKIADKILKNKNEQ
jgi:hypothetical protein